MLLLSWIPLFDWKRLMRFYDILVSHRLLPLLVIVCHCLTQINLVVFHHWVLLSCIFKTSSKRSILKPFVLCKTSLLIFECGILLWIRKLLLGRRWILDYRAVNPFSASTSNIDTNVSLQQSRVFSWQALILLWFKSSEVFQLGFGRVLCGRGKLSIYVVLLIPSVLKW